MNLIWGVILTIISSLAWLGQVISLVNPALGEKLGLTELKAEVDPTFYADVRGEALWDALILWMLPLAGVLLVLNNPAWTYFGLVGGGMYIYFAGRGIVVRRTMGQRNIRIGKPDSLKMIYTFLALWGLAAIITMVMAVAAVSLP